MAGVAQSVRAPGCGSGGRRFNSGHSPHFSKALLKAILLKRNGALLFMILQCQSIYQSYVQGDQTVNVLHDISLSLMQGQITGLVGSSGSGKSTLLHILGLLDTAKSGTVIIGDHIIDCARDQSKQRTAIRKTHIGFIYQFHHLLPQFTALENVMMPLILAGLSKANAAQKSKAILENVGLGHRLSHQPHALSGGEQQRVAIARALVHEPKLILADEPTGNLDNETADIVFALLMEQIKTQNVAAIIATHDLSLASQMDTCLRLHNGHLSVEHDNKTSTPIP